MPSWSSAAALGAAAFALALSGAGPGAAARAHVVLGDPTLRQSIEHADRSAVVRFEGGPRTWIAPDGSDRQEWFRVRVVAPLAGEALPARFDFFPHAEGFPDWRDGDRALLFLHETASRAGFAELAERFPFHSEQGAGREWKLVGPRGDAVLAQARAWAALADASEAERIAGWRARVAAALASPVERLRADARAELMLAVRAPGLIADASQLAPFAAPVTGVAPFPERAALQRLLEAWPFFDPAPGWSALRAEAGDPGRRRALLRAAATSRDPATAAWVAGSLEAEDARVREAAARALARRSDPVFSPALARAAKDPEPRVARAAIRGLGAAGDRRALEALEALRAGGGERARWAAVELRKRARRSDGR